MTGRAPSTALTVLSLFSGLGGMDLGLEKAGFMSVGCAEQDTWAIRSLKANRGGQWPLLEPGDVSALAGSLKPADLGLERGELTLIAGGPPCQPFSKAAQWAPTARRGLADERGVLLFDLLDIVESFLPQVVLIENVPGLLSGPTSILPVLQRAVPSLGRISVRYRIWTGLVDAHTLGVPQVRRRAILVLWRTQGDFTPPKLVPDDARPNAWDAIGQLSVRAKDLPAGAGYWADLLKSIPEGANYQYHTSRGPGLNLFGYRTRYWSFLQKLARDKPSWTITASPGPSTGPFHWENRPLAIPELLRLQSFPSDWIVEGARRDQVRQVGNATPPLMAERLGRSIRSLLGVPAPGPYRLAIRHGTPPPTGSAPVELDSKYLSHVGNHKDHPGGGLGPRPRV